MTDAETVGLARLVSHRWVRNELSDANAMALMKMLCFGQRRRPPCRWKRPRGSALRNHLRRRTTNQSGGGRYLTEQAAPLSSRLKRRRVGQAAMTSPGLSDEHRDGDHERE